MRQETTTTFTPVFETVLQEMGAQAALVFGRVWRYCQAPGGECYASQRKLAEGLGLSAATVNRALKRLVEAGYLRDATPEQRYTPHTYRDTGKATGVLPAETGEQKGVSDSNAVLPTETDCPKSVSVRALKIQVMQDTTKRQQAAAARELAVFREAAGFAPRRQVLEDVVDAIGQVGRRLGRPAEAEDLKPFVRAWARRGWRMDNLAWLTDWAVNGAVPGRAPTRTGTVAHGNDTGTGDSIRLVRNNVSAEERQRLIRFYNGLPDG